MLLKLDDLKGAGEWMTVWAGIVASAVSGMLAIKFLLRYVQTRSYAVFAYYRWVFAAIIVAAFLMRPAPPPPAVEPSAFAQTVSDPPAVAAASSRPSRADRSL